MRQTAEIREAMLRLSSIEPKHYRYDPTGQVIGDGPIQYLLEIGLLLFIAWENNETGAIIINPITRFCLDELEELGYFEKWTVLHVPAALSECIKFREIENSELNKAYRSSEVYGFTEFS